MTEIKMVRVVHDTTFASVTSAKTKEFFKLVENWFTIDGIWFLLY